MSIQESYPTQTTGLGVAAKIAVQGNLGTSTVPGYNDVVLSVSGTNGQTTFQLNPQLQDVAGNEIDPGTSFVLTSVAASSPAAFVLTSVAVSANGVAVYTGTVSVTAASLVGELFTVAGFTGANNNGVFVATANNGSTTLTLENANATAETHAGTATYEDGTAVYTGTIGVTASSLVGQTFVVAGFVTHTSNNGTFIATANNGSTTLTLKNAAALAETHAGTAVSQETNANVFVVSSVGSASAGVSVYTGTFGVAASSLIGQTFKIAGFVTNAVNNGTFVATANNGSTTLTLANTAGIAETHAATATSEPVASELTYLVYPAKTLTGNTYQPSGTSTAIATVSATGLLTAVAEGGVEVEVSYPTFDNTIGDIVSSGNPMNGLPVNKIFAAINLQVVA